MPIPEEMMSRVSRSGAKESKKQQILDEIRKAPTEAQNSTDDDKTKSKNSDHENARDKSNHEDECANSINRDESRQPQPELQSHIPSVTITSHEDVSRLMNFKHDSNQQRPLQRNELTMVRILLKIIKEEKKINKQKGVGGSSSKNGKAQNDTSNFERFDDSWFNKLVDAYKVPEEQELQFESIVMFGKCMMKFLNKDKITKVDMEGPTFELLKNMLKSSIELEYNLKQCHLALTDIIDWTNLEGERFHNDLRKPLPLTGPPGRKSILTKYFFNNDLEYLRHGNEEKKYALSVTKIKNARYKQEGIEELIPYLWSPSIYTYKRNDELGIHHWKKISSMINVPKPKKKKSKVPRKQQTITLTDNLLEDPDEALDLATQINLEEHQKQEKERRSKARHATLMPAKHVNKQANEAYAAQMKLNLKAQKHVSPNAQLLLN
nr:hypothetical protein [Tanacetum cinerariifolium]